MSNELKLLKPGQSGTGILIESDSGYIDPNDYRNKSFVNEVKKLEPGSTMSIPAQLILYVVLQKWGVVNRNGRIYPREILERENNNYQQLIKERRAIGECVPGGTGVFTSKGWVNIEDIKIGDEVFTINVDTNKLEVNKVEDTISKHYKDDMIHIYNNSSLDMMITKKHKVVLWDRNNKPYILTGEELFEKINNGDSKVSHSTIKHSAEWIGEDVEYIKIPNSDYIVDSKLWAAFLGIFISDGHTIGSCGSHKKNVVGITQVKNKTKNKIKELLDKLPFKYTISNDRQFLIYNEALYNFLKPLGNSNEKHIPEYAKNWNVDLLNILFDWLLLGDGRNRSNYKNELLKEYYTVSNRLSDDVFELLLKISNGATYNVRQQKNRYIFDEIVVEKEVEFDGQLEIVKEIIKKKRLIKAENSKPLNIISERRSSGISMDTRFIKAEKISWDDDVYCLTVDNGTWLMKYNDKISWTHNCDHPETSIISVDRISHNIIETWWEGKTLMGKMEILMSPGYINYGIVSTKGDEVANLIRNNIMVGVSSRGVGSLKQINGQNIVQDDFELICWDVVTSPSTPGSWMFTDAQAAKPFTESVEKNKNLLINKINNFLID